MTNVTRRSFLEMALAIGATGGIYLLLPHGFERRIDPRT